MQILIQVALIAKLDHTVDPQIDILRYFMFN